MSIYFGGTCPPGEVEVTTSNGTRVCVHDGGAASVAALKASVAAGSAADEWSNPFTSKVADDDVKPPSWDSTAQPVSAPPMVSADSGSGSWSSVLTGVLDIFGRKVNPVGYNPQGLMPQQQPGLPSWVIPVSIGAGVLLLTAVMVSGRRASVAGYRRKRKHRRSKR